MVRSYNRLRLQLYQKSLNLKVLIYVEKKDDKHESERLPMYVNNYEITENKISAKWRIKISKKFIFKKEGRILTTEIRKSLIIEVFKKFFLVTLIDYS